MSLFAAFFAINAQAQSTPINETRGSISPTAQFDLIYKCIGSGYKVKVRQNFEGAYYFQIKDPSTGWLSQGVYSETNFSNARDLGNSVLYTVKINDHEFVCLTMSKSPQGESQLEYFSDAHSEPYAQFDLTCSAR